MELHQGIILGVLQGLTEFLPVSSSGHLVLGQTWFGITESQLVFDISVHIGTLLAVLVVYRNEIFEIVRSVLDFCVSVTRGEYAGEQFVKNEPLQMALAIIIGSVPTAAMGILLKQYEHVLFSSALLVGITLLITGTMLWLSRRYYNRASSDGSLTIKKALFVGVGQGLAVIPGISRSGTTIAAGMFMGLSRHKAATFSFLLSIPAIAGAQLLSIKDMIENDFALDPVTVWATLVSFITGLIALKILIKLVNAGRFHYFAPYCWLLGIVTIVLQMI